MLKQLALRFGVRWIVSSLGLWIAATILGSSRLNFGDSLKTLLISGFFLAVVNMLIKPFLVILSFPAIILSLGLFMLIVNAFLIELAHWIYSPLYVKDFWVAIIAGIIIGLVNFLVTKVMEDVK